MASVLPCAKPMSYPCFQALVTVIPPTPAHLFLTAPEGWSAALPKKNSVTLHKTPQVSVRTAAYWELSPCDLPGLEAGHRTVSTSSLPHLWSQTLFRAFALIPHGCCDKSSQMGALNKRHLPLYSSGGPKIKSVSQGLR